MADPRLVEFNIMRLTDKNREVRLRSVEELRLLGDEAALPALRNVFNDADEDTDIREAAQRAGREIYLKNHPNVRLPGSGQ